MDRRPIRSLWNEHVEQCPNCKYVFSVLRRPYVVPSVPYFSVPKSLSKNFETQTSFSSKGEKTSSEEE